MGRTLAPAGNDRDYLQLAELSTYLRPAGLSMHPDPVINGGHDDVP